MCLSPSHFRPVVVGLVLALYPAVSAEVMGQQDRDEDTMDCE
jgi:hypothetical protein